VINQNPLRQKSFALEPLAVLLPSLLIPLPRGALQLFTIKTLVHTAGIKVATAAIRADNAIIRISFAGDP
jgi:hypothetical protein